MLPHVLEDEDGSSAHSQYPKHDTAAEMESLEQCGDKDPACGITITGESAKKENNSGPRATRNQVNLIFEERSVTRDENEERSERGLQNYIESTRGSSRDVARKRPLQVSELGEGEVEDSRHQRNIAEYRIQPDSGTPPIQLHLRIENGALPIMKRWQSMLGWQSGIPFE